MIGQIKKRYGSVVKFDKSKITNAIYNAAREGGNESKQECDKVADKVLEKIEREMPKGSIPTVEGIQDLVEQVLIETGHAKTAKAYIIYRQKRAEIRAEKKHVLEKEEIDEVDKKFDVNALRVLKARYLRKDDSGKLIETPKQLFTRVAVNTALADLFYDERVFDKDSKQQQHEKEEFEPAMYDGELAIGKYVLNRYHLEAVRRMYDRFDRQNNMKVSWSEFLDMLKEGLFNKYEKTTDEFFDIMVNRQFMPNTPAIANFGSVLGMGSACYVLGVEDDLTSIMDTLKHTALIHQSGGGTGFNFSKLRPEGDIVKSTCGAASGPISFMTLYDNMTDVIKQGGMRRGANMGILNSNHPDIEKFITAKEGNKALRNFNISVLIMGDFWDYYERDEPYPLINPRNGEVYKTVNPKMLFDKIVYQAWESAEPGVIFFDRVNEFNPFLEHLGPIVTTNPCGEVLLYPNEPCNLGSVNVWAFANEDEDGNTYIDWDDMARVTKIATHFLDNVIDVNKWPLQQIEDMALATRKIGLGIMGVGDLLFDVGLPYNEDEGRIFMEKLMEFVNYWSKVKSIDLAKERGSLPYYDKSFYLQGRLPFRGSLQKDKWHFEWDELAESVKTAGIRNGYTTIIAPTGSISMIAGCSSGIEPVYSLVFEKNVKVGSFYYIDPVFEKVMKREGLYDEDLMKQIAENRGSIQNVPYIPQHLKNIFVTAMDATPESHIRALAAFQVWVDSSISKTNNFPANATVEDMRQSYLLAYQLGCKDVTVFRDSSIKEQVLVAPSKTKTEELKKERYVLHTPSETVTETASGTLVQHVTNGKMQYKECPTCSSKALSFKEGCLTCESCGWGLCA
ncbi:MAG: adenosylcobalamin-dependent ribonucleoside-diphosphate reductase [Candidatus Aenigmarchaeota archaeon]|nr:adenosylcobalamin-dependent ribonucleoside-diphosphate reductase [Candidatus Aenigmarchaeota archaeon]